ncbi:zf-RVT domain-containing protein [Cephalotus follicularis]|uniref:Zf-RVT domain-containing protein n=1 Tax=Cephalotus follicularis TaxID=3775 RepID=A0A1Q3CAQ2_CEPFO|nr:zf-RVT domain-containing protein [Cephalotus follicularis]
MQDIPSSNALDCIFWQTDGHAFSTKTAWQAIRTHEDKVNWYRLVWHTLRIPKHAFCLWLMILGAHKTRDKLLALGIVASTGCVFNCGEIESIDYLFFACPYTQNLWQVVLNMCNIHKSILPRPDEVQWMIEHSNGRKFPAFLKKMALGATVYHFWRNHRIFRNAYLPQQEIIHKIRKDVVCKYMGLVREIEVYVRIGELTWLERWMKCKVQILGFIVLPVGCSTLNSQLLIPYRRLLAVGSRLVWSVLDAVV